MFLSQVLERLSKDPMLKVAISTHRQIFKASEKYKFMCQTEDQTLISGSDSIVLSGSEAELH